MNLQNHKAAVGAFILAALALLVTGIIALGGGKYLASDTEYVLYFNNSVTGLNIGSPVMLRGVNIGTVTRITLMTTASNGGVTTPVHIRIYAENLTLTTGEHVDDETTEQEVIREMISKGLRAQLQTASLLTGSARIQLDFHPDTAARFQSPNPLLEIPTMNSPIDNLQQTLSKLPVEDIAASMLRILNKIDGFVTSGQIEQTLTSVRTTFDTMNGLLKGLEEAPAQINAILASVNAGTRQTPQAMAELRKALQEFTEAVEEIHSVATSARNMVDPGSALAAQLNNLIRDGAAAARSLRSFADTLNRNPESVLRGRQGAY